MLVPAGTSKNSSRLFLLSLAIAAMFLLSSSRAELNKRRRIPRLPRLRKEAFRRRQIPRLRWGRPSVRVHQKLRRF